MVALLLVPVRDATPSEVVGGEFHLHLVAGKDADVVHAHLSGDVGQDFVPVVERDLEHCVRKRFEDLAFQHDRVFLGLGQNSSSCEAPVGGSDDVARNEGGSVLADEQL